jgi:hypothetical protein
MSRFRAWLSPGFNAAGRWVDDHAPRLGRALHPAWQVVNRRLRLTSYWGQRKHLRYYKEVASLARVHCPAARSVLDVGAGDTELVRGMDWIPLRVALDAKPADPTPGVERVVANFLDYRPPRTFDLVLCLQVLEHLEAPVPFFRKLLSTGRTVIVSVPHRWPKGLAPRHVQDPVDEGKLSRWAGRDPVSSVVVHNARARLVAVFRGDDVG